MGELIHEALLIYNMPITLMVGLCVVYWLSVCIGVLDISSFDADLGLDADADIHGEVDGGSEVHGDPAGGALMALARFANIHEVPLMVVLSVLFILMWVIGMLSNHFVNPMESWLVGGGLLVANFIVSTVLTRAITSPLKPLMRGLKKDWDDDGGLVGKTGIVKTSEVNETFGQVEISRKGAPSLCHAKVPEGVEPLERGAAVIVIDYLTETQTCIVKRLDGDQLEL